MSCLCPLSRKLNPLLSRLQKVKVKILLKTNLMIRIGMFARNLRDLLNSKGDPEGTEQVEVETRKKDLYGPKCVKCSTFAHIQADCGNLKQAKRKALHAVLNDDSSKD
jgi:hypothetical protein